MPGLHGSGCSCKHENELTGKEFLLPYIEVDGIVGFNEKSEGSAKAVFKAYDNRLDDRVFVETPEDDTELLIRIPFKSPVKVTSLHVIGGDCGQSPSKVKLFANSEIDFTDIGETPVTQEVELVEDYCGAVEYPTKLSKFQNVTTLCMYFEGNFGAKSTKISYIGIRGEGSQWKRQAVITTYEASANLKDHKVPEDETNSAAPQF
eukprot:Platyproteum_vivax@DN3904_c0_g1_i2.p1